MWMTLSVMRLFTYTCQSTETALTRPATVFGRMWHLNRRIIRRRPRVVHRTFHCSACHSTRVVASGMCLPTARTAAKLMNLWSTSATLLYLRRRLCRPAASRSPTNVQCPTTVIVICASKGSNPVQAVYKMILTFGSKSLVLPVCKKQEWFTKVDLLSSPLIYTVSQKSSTFGFL